MENVQTDAVHFISNSKGRTVIGEIKGCVWSHLISGEKADESVFS